MDKPSTYICTINEARALQSETEVLIRWRPDSNLLEDKQYCVVTDTRPRSKQRVAA